MNKALKYAIIFREAARAYGYLSLGEIDSINKELKLVDNISDAESVLSKYDLQTVGMDYEVGKEIRYDVGWAGTLSRTKDRAVLRNVGNGFMLDIPRDEKDKKREIAKSKHRKPVGPFTFDPDNE